MNPYLQVNHFTISNQDLNILTNEIPYYLSSYFCILKKHPDMLNLIKKNDKLKDLVDDEGNLIIIDDDGNINHKFFKIECWSGNGWKDSYLDPNSKSYDPPLGYVCAEYMYKKNEEYLCIYMINNDFSIIDFKKEDKRILEDKLEALLKKEHDYEFSEEDFLSIFRVYHPLNYEKNNIHRNVTGKLKEIHPKIRKRTE